MLALEPSDEAQASKVPVVVLGSGTRRADRRQQALGQVVAHGTRRHAGQIRQLCQVVARIQT